MKSELQMPQVDLEKIQKDNLIFAETWARSEVNGVDVIQPMSYFLVQILNNMVVQAGKK
jgi:hypothetical protein